MLAAFCPDTMFVIIPFIRSARFTPVTKTDDRSVKQWVKMMRLKCSRRKLTFFADV